MTLRNTLALCAIPVGFAGCAARGVQPDIVLILADDLGIGDVSCFNPDGKIPTPNIDRLAGGGVMFTDAHSTSALSTPSRYSVLTGRYPWRTTLKQGVLGGYSDSMIEEGRRTVADELSARGYRTACIGKWHLGWHWSKEPEGNVDYSVPITDGPVEHGFEKFFGIAASLDMAPFVFVSQDRAVEPVTRRLAKDGGVHLLHGGEAGETFEPRECLPELTRRAVAEVEGWKDSREPHFLYLPLTAPHTPCLPSPEFKGRTGLGDYGDFVAMMDDAVGQVIDAVERTGRMGNTLIVFASDNGCAPYADTRSLEAKGHYPSAIYRGYKNDIFEGGHRIPLVVGGGLKLIDRSRGTKVDGIVTLADLFNTFIEVSGGEELRDGRVCEDSFSLVPYLRGRGRKPVHQAIISVSGNGFFSIRNRQYKLIFTAGSGGWSYPSKPAEIRGLPPMQLYDILSDPGETTNLIGEESLQPMIEAMTAELRRYIENGRTNKGTSVSNDTSPLWRQTEPIFGD